jgi:hypothetical protein
VCTRGGRRLGVDYGLLIGDKGRWRGRQASALIGLLVSAGWRRTSPASLEIIARSAGVRPTRTSRGRSRSSTVQHSTAQYEFWGSVGECQTPTLTKSTIEQQSVSAAAALHSSSSRCDRTHAVPARTL